MFELLITFVIVAVVALIWFSVFPVVVSALYKGNPPAHLAGLLNEQTRLLTEIIRHVLAPLKHMRWQRDGTSDQSSPKDPP